MKHKKIFKTSGSFTKKESCFTGLTDEEIDTHLAIKKYGRFLLTDAVSPSYDLQVTPKTGFKCDHYITNCDECQNQTVVPVMVISASKEILFPLFLDLLDLFEAEKLGIILETSHKALHGDRAEFENDEIDASVLKSILLEFEDLLLNDGCAGIAVMDQDAPREIQFDEHKIIYLYNWYPIMKKLLAILEKHNVPQYENMDVITDAEHIHQSSNIFETQFKKFVFRIGADENSN